MVLISFLLGTAKSACEDGCKLYDGEWTLNLHTNSSTPTTFTSYFGLRVKNDGTEGWMITHGLGRFKMSHARMLLKGGYLEECGRFFMFNVTPASSFIGSPQMLILKSLYKQSSPMSLYQLYCNLRSNLSIIGSVHAVEFAISDLDSSNRTFGLGKQLTGTFFTPDYNFSIRGDLFNEELYIVESRKFSVMIAFETIILFYSWFFLKRETLMYSSFSKLSLHTFILQVGYDFSFCVFILYAMSEQNRRLPVFSFLFLVVLSIILGYGIYFICLLCQHITDSMNIPNDINNNELWIFYFAIVESTIIVIFSIICVSMVFKFPVISLVFLTSTYLPQIIKSAVLNTRNALPSLFVVLNAMYRLIPLLYVSFYTHSIYERHSIEYGVIFTVWTIFQCAFLLIQNRFGGSFFLPSCVRPRQFFYKENNALIELECSICLTQINDSETLYTPCGHPFHSECLQRWLVINPVCPLCRSRLPPLEDFI